MRNKILSVVFLGGVLVSCNKYDCPEDYKGWVVVKGITENYTLKNGCEYKEVKFPDVYGYSTEDTVGVSLTWQQEINKTLTHSRKIIREVDSMMVEINNIE